MASPISKLKEIKREQLSIYEEEREEKSSRPWDTAEWAENREEKLAEKCQWCGESDTTLQLHHYEEPEFNYDQMWIQVENRLFIQSDAFILDEMIEEPTNCPNCMSSNFYERKTKTPAFRCRRCEFEFPKADAVTVDQLQDFNNVGGYANGAFYYGKLDWMKQNKEKVRAEFSKEHDKHWEKYISLDETITICQRCHFMHHEHGMKICDICGDDYGKPRSDFSEDYVCWDCVIDEKGLILCKECGENWHDPSKTSKCSSCRSG